MWGLLIFIVGLLYGFMTPGRQNKGRLFANGLWIGVVLAIVLTLIGAGLGFAVLPLGATFMAVVLDVIILTLVFVLGAWVGDAAEGARRHGPMRRI